MSSKQFFIIVCIGIAGVFGVGLSQAQTAFPDKPLHIVVPQPPGGGFDLTGRILADKMAPLLKESFIVDNRPGVGTVVGTDYVAKLPADGYTAVVGSISNMVMNPFLYKNLSYDPIKDFVPVGLVASYSYTLIGRKGLPFTDLKGLIQYAKANPGKLTYASGGNGTGQHVLAAALWHTAGVDLVHIPYKGAQAAYTDIIGGRVDLFFDLSPTAKPQIDSGSVVAFATSGAARNPNLPNIPTITETGVSTVQLDSWFGLFMPAKTPPAILAKWQEAFTQVANSADVKERFEKGGGKPMSVTPAEVSKIVQRDYNRWQQLIKAADVKAD
jgi:tripartite-type tricarboxylate transporter receptor subunit TctC